MACSLYGGSGSGGRLSLTAIVDLSNYTLSACGGSGVAQFNPGGAGTIYRSVGPSGSEYVTVLVSNCGMAGPAAAIGGDDVLTYSWGLLTVQRSGILRVLSPPVSSVLPTTVTALEVGGDKTGSIVVENRVSVVVVNWAATDPFVQNVGFVVMLGGNLVTPDTTVLKQVAITVYGQLQEPANLIISTGATLTLMPSAFSENLPPGSFVFNNLRVNSTGSVVMHSVAQLIVTGNISLTDSATLVLHANATGLNLTADGVDIEDTSTVVVSGVATARIASRLTVAPGASIRADGGGYLSGDGGCGVSSPGSGGSSGGYGSVGSYGGAVSPPCTSFQEPIDLGAGGQAWGGAGGAGGGAMALFVNGTSQSFVQIDGTLSSNGLAGTGTCSGSGGGGSGGAIWLVTPLLYGSGAITARGGTGGEHMLCVIVAL